MLFYRAQYHPGYIYLLICNLSKRGGGGGEGGEGGREGGEGTGGEGEREKRREGFKSPKASNLWL